MAALRFFDKLEFISWGFHENFRGWTDQHVKTYHSVNYVHRGSLDFRNDGGNFLRIEAPAVWLTFPGKRFEYGNKDPGWEHRYVAFRGSRADLYSRNGLYPSDKTPPIFPVKNSETFRRVFDELLVQLKLPLVRRRRAVHTLEGLLLQLCEQNTAPEETGRGDRKIVEIAEAVGLDPLKEWDFEVLAGEAGFSYSHFRKRFKEKIGLAPHEHLLEMKLERAAHALEDQRIGLEEAARQAGFGDVYYFSKLFKKRFNLSPGKYREAFGNG